MPTILCRQNLPESPSPRWRQYLIVSNARVVVVHMIEAWAGWNYGRVDIQGSDDWLGMSEVNILEFKRRVDDGKTDFNPPLTASDRVRLLEIAERGIDRGNA